VTWRLTHLLAEEDGPADIGCSEPCHGFNASILADSTTAQRALPWQRSSLRSYVSNDLNWIHSPADAISRVFALVYDGRFA
jgi:hypothetical protein